MTPVPTFMLRWPSWAVEACGAAVLVAGACALWLLYLLLPPLAVGVVASGASYVYETKYDGNGWSLADFVQREWVIIALCAAWVVLL